MTISVVIPTYNRKQLIGYTLDSLDGRHHAEDIEIIVVDDGSDDGTVDMIRVQYPHVRLITGERKGAAYARNAGLAAASGECIMYLDSDDLVGPHFFTKKLAALERQPELQACYGAYEVFSSDGEFSQQAIIFRHKYPVIPAAGNEAAHLANYLSGNYLPPNSIVWRTAFVRKIGGHEQALTINQDVELFIRAIFHGAKIQAVADDTFVYIRHHSLDDRVGDPKTSAKKWEQILALREQVFRDLSEYGFDTPGCRAALSLYLFNQWKQLRHQHPGIAAGFLNLAKKVQWPPRVKGGLFYKTLSGLFGPVNAVRLKYLLLKRD